MYGNARYPPNLGGMTNNIATSLFTWESAGAQHLRALPVDIVADLNAIVIRSAARVIAGRPVFEQSTENSQPKENTKSDIPPAVKSFFSYAKIAKKFLSAQVYPPKITKRSSSASKPEPDLRIIVRLAPDHPWRHKNFLNLRTKLRSFLDRLELIKDIRSIPSDTAHVALSTDKAPELFQVAVALQSVTEIVPIKR